MAVGTSLGAYYDTDLHHLAGIENNVIDPETTPDLGTRDQNVKPVTVPKTSSTMPVGGPTEPAGALKSQPGTSVPPENGNINLPDINDVPHHDWVENVFKAAKDAFQLPGEVFGGKIDPMSDQGIERAADLAGLMVFGPAPVASKLADGTLGSFAGVRSKTIDKSALYKAQEMELNGIHPDDIWHDTGTFKGADGRWRQEISDENAKLNDKGFDKTIIQSKGVGKDWLSAGGTEDQTLYSIKDMGKDFFGKSKSTLTLPDILDHPELYKAYPELKNIKIRPVPESASKNSIGSFSPLDNTITLKDNLHPEYARGVILHEVQHAIQEYEGFAKGGSPSMFFNQSVGDPSELYRRLMGEVEARNVQSRRDFDWLKKKITTPQASEDVPRFSQINPESKRSR